VKITQRREIRESQRQRAGYLDKQTGGAYFAPEGAVDAEDLASFLAYYSSSDEPPDPQFLATVSPEALARLIQSVNEDDDQGKSLIALLGQVVWSRVRTPSLRSIRTAAFQHCGLLSTNIAIIQCDDGMNPLLT